MLRWAKITEEIGADEKLCGLAERNTMAALLFTWSLPKADVYAIIPGSSTEYRARVCPGMDISKAEVQKCIDAQIKAGLLHPYTDNGKPLLYIINYHKHQSIKWGRVGEPVNNLPPCWRVPQELRQFMEEEDCDRQPAFYGLTDALEPKSRTTPGLLLEDSGENVLDVDPDVDPDADSDVDAETTSTADAAASKEVVPVEEEPEQLPLIAVPTPPEPEPPPPEREPTELTGAHAAALIEQYPTEHDDLIVIRECWEAFGFDGAPGGHGYSGLRELVQTFGYVHYQAWAAHIRKTKPRQPSGTKPWKFFAKEFRRAASRDFDWAPKQAGSRSGGHPSGKGVADVGNHESGEVVWDNEGNPIGRRPA